VAAARPEARSAIAEREATLAETLARLTASEDAGAAQAAALEAAAAREAALATELSEAEAARLAERAAAEALRARLAGVETELTEAEAARLAELAAAETLRARLREADTELTAMTLALEEQRRRAEETLTLLAAAEAARATAEAEATASLTEAERRAGLLAAARAALGEQEAQSAEDSRRLTLLNQQVAQLRNELGNLQAILNDSSDRDLEAQIEIQALGSQLNLALARVAAEERRRAAAEEEARRLEEAERLRLEAEAQRLERYASEFFGRLLEVLEGRAGVQVVGDRFILASEVLFPPAGAELSAEGQAQIAGVVGLLREISDDIPPGIDWILRVDGHTDNVPLSGGGAFADNWALSQARALSVVRYMTQQLGFPPQRLAAAGFGEYRPVASNATEAGRAQNRRIELKLTER
jgi:chemotaxis protein MotB